MPGRKEPTTGEMNYQNIFKHIHEKVKATSRDFVFGMEHGNFAPGKEGEQKLIEAYVRSGAWSGAGRTRNACVLGCWGTGPEASRVLAGLPHVSGAS